jgi:hypothetical protein
MKWAHGWMIFRTERLHGRSVFQLRVGDYRVLYEFDAQDWSANSSIGHNTEQSLA